MAALKDLDLWEWQRDKAYGEVFEADIHEDEIDDIDYNKDVI